MADGVIGMRDTVHEFEAFRDHVFANNALRDQLLMCSDLDELVALTVHQGAARGHGFSATDVMAQVHSARRDWLEQWIPMLQPDGAQHAMPRAHSVELNDFDGWLPVRLFISDNTLCVHWCYAGERRFEQSFFFEDAYALHERPFNLVFQRRTPISALVTWASGLERTAGFVPLKAIIANVSRCGSTLICQMLAALPSHQVLSEPPQLDMLLNVRRHLPHVTRDQQIDWLRAMVVALGQRKAGEVHTVMKLDAWHILEIALLKDAFPAASIIFLFRDPLEVAASHLNQPTTYTIPGAVSRMPWLPPPDAMIWSSRERYIAAVLGKIYACGADACERFDLRAIDYRSLPNMVWGELAEMLGLNPDGDMMEAMSRRAAYDSKSSIQRFDRAAQRPHNADAKDVLRDAINEFCAESFLRLQAAATQSRP